MDFITRIPLSDGKDVLLLFTDKFTKAILLIPCNKTTSAEDTARLYLTVPSSCQLNLYRTATHISPAILEDLDETSQRLGRNDVCCKILHASRTVFKVSLFLV
jgi:hypothetical protein